MYNYSVSVIAGIYNPPKILFQKFLDSCLNSSLVSCEYILILDDPTDKTSIDLLDEYKKNMDNSKCDFKIIKNDENLGIIPTYNNGLKIATGEYVVFFDSDDFFDSEYLEVMYNYCKEQDLDVLTGYSLTHYFGKIDHFPSTFLESLNNDVWVNMFNTKFLLENDIGYVDDPIMIEMVRNKGNNKIGILPLEYGVFYHYVRHDNNISKYDFKDNLIRLSNQIEDLEKSHTQIQHELNALKKLVFNDEIKNEKLDIGDNNDLDYNRIKQI